MPNVTAAAINARQVTTVAVLEIDTSNPTVYVLLGHIDHAAALAFAQQQVTDALVDEGYPVNRAELVARGAFTYTVQYNTVYNAR